MSAPGSFTHRVRRLPAGTVSRVVALVVALLVGWLVANLLAGLALAPDRVRGEDKQYGLPSARVSMQLREDGSIDVLERITFDFDGSFSGAYRDIPLRQGDELTNIAVCDQVGGAYSSGGAPSVPDVSQLDPAAATAVLDAYYRAFPQLEPPSEQGATMPHCPKGLQAYEPGASTVLGSSGAPGTFGTETLPNPRGNDEEIPEVERVVWHYASYDEQRTFTIAYRATGWLREPVSSTDLVVLETSPWGSEWQAALGSLVVDVRMPSGARFETGDAELFTSTIGAARVRGRVAVPEGATGGQAPALVMTADDLTSGERADLTALLPSTDLGIDPEQLETSERTVSEIREAGRDAERHNRQLTSQLEAIDAPDTSWLILAALAAGTLLGAVCARMAWVRTLREEPWPADVPQLLPDPPSNLSPALAASLVEQRTDVSPNALVATIFDLVRRGAYTTLPAQGDQRGAKVDIALRQSEAQLELTSYEQSVRELVNAILMGTEVAMGEFKSRLKNSLPMSNRVAKKQQGFEDSVKAELVQRGWMTRPPARWLVVPSLIGWVLLLVAIVAIAWTGLGWAIDSDPRVTTVVGTIVGAFAFGLVATLTAVMTARQVMLRYASKHRTEAAQWVAYRDFLDSYGDMQDEQTASIELWERHLVYAIAFGVADDILSAVRPQGTAAADTSSLAQMRPSTFHGFAAGVAARAPQPSSSSGGGGGSSGGFSGGGGGGGGGGGAW